MRKALYIAKADIRKQKGASVSLFIIIMLVSLLLTAALSIITGVTRDYEAGVKRLNGLHSVIIMEKDAYKPSFEDIIRNDERVTKYDIGEAVYNFRLQSDYGGEMERTVMILNADTELNVARPVFTEKDDSIPRGTAVYLPRYAQKIGYGIGSVFTLTYRNKPINLTVAGFFDAAEYTTPNADALKFFVPDECFEFLKGQMGSFIWIAAQFNDPYDSTAFNRDFRSQIDVEISSLAEDGYVADFNSNSESTIMPVMTISAVILLFAVITVIIALLVIRFRVTNNIEDSMHDIGVRKAAGFTSGQIISGYLTENFIIALPAVLLGVLFAVPVFAGLRQVLGNLGGITWMLGVNFPAAFAQAVLTIAVMLVMVALSCRKIHKLQPVEALRGESVSVNRRRNFFPLQTGMGCVHVRLGLKSTTAYLKRYVMIGAVLAVSAFIVVIVAALYQNFVLDRTALIRMAGIETADIDITVARHTDADALAARLEELPQVRKTSMLDWCEFKIDGADVLGFVSNDFNLMETISTHEGRYPKYDNEVAIPLLFANRLGKTIGDSVKVSVGTFSAEYIICGYFSTANRGGNVGMLTLAGYQRLDPNYRRGSINVYLSGGVSFKDFSKILETDFGVVNVHNGDENDRFAAAKARAEEKIAAYLEFYGIDSVDYAVIYNGEIIICGSSREYQIEKITDFKEWADTQISSYSGIVGMMTQAVTIIAAIIVGLILVMTTGQMVAKRRRELGILKSGGYTTRQLAGQLVMSFLPCAVPGVLIGCICGAYCVNPAVSAMFASTGVSDANVHIYPQAAAAIGIAVLLFTFAVVYISALRIKHISVYELLSE